MVVGTDVLVPVDVVLVLVTDVTVPFVAKWWSAWWWWAPCGW